MIIRIIMIMIIMIIIMMFLFQTQKIYSIGYRVRLNGPYHIHFK